MAEGIFTHLYLTAKLMPFITSHPDVSFMLHKCQHFRALSRLQLKGAGLLCSEQMQEAVLL